MLFREMGRIIKGPLCSRDLKLKFMSLVPRTEKPRDTVLASFFLFVFAPHPYGYMVIPEGFE
jgi:hypothetical protein